MDLNLLEKNYIFLLILCGFKYQTPKYQVPHSHCSLGENSKNCKILDLEKAHLEKIFANIFVLYLPLKFGLGFKR
jgi:hypothetical protein